MTGAASGTTRGEPAWTSTASRSTARCTATCGPTAPRSAWSSPTTDSRSTSGSPSPPTHPVRSCGTTSRAASTRAAYVTRSSSGPPCARWSTTRPLATGPGCLPSPPTTWMAATRRPRSSTTSWSPQATSRCPTCPTTRASKSSWAASFTPTTSVTPSSSPAGTSSSWGPATRPRTSARSATSTVPTASTARHGPAPWATTGPTTGRNFRSSPTWTATPSTSPTARPATCMPSSCALGTSITSPTCLTTFGSRRPTGCGCPASTRAWCGSGTRSSSTSGCRTSTTHSTCSTRRPGTPATS